MEAENNTALYGLMAEFDTPSAVVRAARRAYAAGYRKLNGYSPFPIEELSEAIGFHKTILPWLVFAGGVIGGVGGYLLIYFTAVIDYPIMVGGKPIYSWPMYIPITFECTILGAALTAVLSMLLLNGLPQPYHPVFNVPRFALASREKFFLVVEAKDPKYDYAETKGFLESLHAAEVFDVEK
jgi:hypothetical protein